MASRAWAAVLALGLAVATPAAAEQGEHVLTLRGAWAHADSHGGGAGLRWAFGIDDFWNVSAGAGWALLPDESAGSLQLVRVDAGVLYHLDAFQWVPWLEVTLGGWLGMGDGDPAPAFGFSVGGGIDYRPARRWGVGLFGAWQQAIAGDVPGHATAGLRLSLYL